MYGWTDDTDKWRGKRNYNFGTARARYDKAARDAGATGPRDYARRESPDMTLVDPRGKELRSDSTNPVIIAVDVTGSMAEWPAEIFDRLPLLYKTLAKYKPDLDLCFAAIGDAHSDDYPLQVSGFSNNIQSLEANLKALGCEGGGGGQTMESYELFAYFVREKIRTPNAASPFLLIFGDEKPYDRVDKKQVQHLIGDRLDESLATDAVIRDVMQRFNVYFMQKPYDEGVRDDITREVRTRWGTALGPQRIIQTPDKTRAVDQGLGLIAKMWGEYEDFKLSVNARHDDPDVLRGIEKSLRNINPAAGDELQMPGAT